MKEKDQGIGCIIELCEHFECKIKVGQNESVYMDKHRIRNSSFIQMCKNQCTAFRTF